ncbi:MAG: hypothetical protein F4Y03_02625 [Alphaproteobacteria bacterium]|nr:hypothetical protein [Alphaproteobacteria bacterium]
MNGLAFRDVKVDPVALTHEERRRFFFYARWNAYQAMVMGVNVKGLGHPYTPFQDEAMRWLEVARDVFPLTQHGETCSIEDILNGKEPAEVPSP